MRNDRRCGMLGALVAASLLWTPGLPAQAQFGTNKITYSNFDWQVY